MSSDTTGMVLAQKAAELASFKRHHLAAYMVDGKHPLTQAAFDGIMKNLARCENKEGLMAQPTGAERYFTERATASPEYQQALTAAREQPRLTFQDIPAGFYATKSATGNNDCDFWKVTVGKKDFRGAKRVIGGGDLRTPKLIEIPKAQQITALRAIISAGIPEAARLYADLEQRCTSCGRQLTDEDSRRWGKGKICQGKDE